MQKKTGYGIDDLLKDELEGREKNAYIRVVSLSIRRKPRDGSIKNKEMK